MIMGRTSFTGRAWRRASALRDRYSKNTDGATAVEFAMVSLPFLAIIFGILELALVFFTGSVLTQSMNDTGRLVRVGAFQGCGSAAEFKAMVCDRMHGMMSCENNLRVDLVTAASFQSVAMKDPGDGGLDPDDDTKGVENGEFDNTGPGEPVVMRGTFYYPLVLPNFMTRLENQPGTGRHVITVSTAFRNEPFPGGGSCNPSIKDKLEGILG